jgi:hypothetical protein
MQWTSDEAQSQTHKATTRTEGTMGEDRQRNPGAHQRRGLGDLRKPTPWLRGRRNPAPSGRMPP